MSRLRAVEHGRAVAHISTVGVSALVRPDGSVAAMSGHFSQETLLASLPLRNDLTIATRLGVWPEGRSCWCSAGWPVLSPDTGSDRVRGPRGEPTRGRRRPHYYAEP